MLTAHRIYKTYGIQPILEDISLSINPGERVGLIGPNGCGKTTLLRILAQAESPDSGTITSMPKDLRIEYLAQGLALTGNLDVRTGLGVATRRTAAAGNEIPSIASTPSTTPDARALQTNYQQSPEQPSSSHEAISKILGPLGLGLISVDTPMSHLSGGQKTRLMLARILLERPQLLLLDEPTNHLDIEILEWLEAWLKDFGGAALIVSHDRAFLDHTVSRILDLDPETHTTRAYAGNYSSYLEQYSIERKKQKAAYADQLADVRSMQQDIVRTKQQSLRVELSTTPRQPGVRRIAKKVARKALSREKKLDRYLKSEDRVERPKESWQLKLEFEAPAHQSKDVLVTENLSVGYSRQSPLLSGLNLHIRAGERIVLTGPNGAGKTTLLRTLAGKLEPLGGILKLGPAVKLGYLAQEQELLDPNLSALQSLQRVAPFNQTQARNFLHFFLFEGDQPLRPSRELSFGERTRLQLGLLVAQGCTFLLLDEPINHLDIPSRSRFEQALKKFEGSVLAVVHDRYFIDRFASIIWTAKAGKVLIR